MAGSFLSPRKSGQARAAPHQHRTKQPAKGRCGSGVVYDFLTGVPDFFYLRGLVAASHAHPESNLAVAKEHSTKVGLCKEAHTRHRILCCELLVNQQATSKIWFLYSSEGFLPYIRDVVRGIVKITHIHGIEVVLTTASLKSTCRSRKSGGCCPPHPPLIKATAACGGAAAAAAPLPPCCRSWWNGTATLWPCTYPSLAALGGMRGLGC